MAAPNIDPMQRSRYDFPSDWEGVCENPYLKDLPFKVEINRFGKIELSPHNRWHSLAQAKIQNLLQRMLKGGTAFPECAIRTADRGTPVADVVWESTERSKVNGLGAVSELAPEICVEVRSPSNSREEMRGKLDAYFDTGALEVWFCGEDGQMFFHAPEGPLERSRLCPKFPLRVVIKL